MTDLDTRVCAWPGCDKTLVRRPDERVNRWISRECCSKACSSELTWSRKAVDAPARACARQECGTQLTPRQRKYCAKTCADLDRRTDAGDARREGQAREAARQAEQARTGVVQARTQLPRTVAQPHASTAPVPKVRAIWRPNAPGWPAIPGGGS